MKYKVYNGDVVKVLESFSEGLFDGVLCDPPYHLTSEPGAREGFLGNTWDGGDYAFRPETWAAVLRVMKPGAYLMAFGGSRVFHRLACGIEDGGFKLLDTMIWLYSTGMPKGVKPARGLARINPPLAKAWEGYNTALKPSYEPIVVAMRPLDGTFANNASRHGVAGFNVDACRVNDRWPANIVVDDEAAESLGKPARAYYCAKVSRTEREFGLSDKHEEQSMRFGPMAAGKPRKNIHPTLKPIELTAYLSTLILPPPRQDGKRRLLVPFSGASSEMIGALLAGWDRVVGIEGEAKYVAIANERLAAWTEAFGQV